MVLCKFYLQGTCKMGTNCKFDHQINPGQNVSAAKNIPADINTLVRAVQADMTNCEKGGQWILSSYAPFKEKPEFPGFEDKSPEEVRFQHYEAVANGTAEIYKQQLQIMLQDAMMKIRALQNPSPDIINLLKQIYNTPVNNPSSNSIFGGTTANAGSIFGGGTPSAVQANPSPFQAPGNYSTQIPGYNNPQMAQTQSSPFIQTGSLFNTVSQTAVSPFQSQPQTTPMYNSQPQNTAAVFNSQVQSTSVFNTQPTSVFNTQPQGSIFTQPQGASIFSNQPQATVSPFNTQSQGTAPAFNTGNYNSQMPGYNNPQMAQTQSSPFIQTGSLFNPVSQTVVSPFQSQPQTTPIYNSQPQNTAAVFSSQVQSTSVFNTQPTSVFNTQQQGSIFTQQQGASIFSNQPQATVLPFNTQSQGTAPAFNSQPQATVSPFNVQATAIISGMQQHGQSGPFKTQANISPFTAVDNPTMLRKLSLYSKEEDLTQEELNAFKSDLFVFGMIPEKPPTLQMC